MYFRSEVEKSIMAVNLIWTINVPLQNSCHLMKEILLQFICKLKFAKELSLLFKAKNTTKH